MKVNTNFIVQKVKGKVTVYDAEKSILHTLNDTAAVVYQGVQMKWSKEKTVKKIAVLYRAKESVVAKDFDEIIKDMLQKKILQK